MFPETLRYQNMGELIRAAANFILQQARERIREKGFFTLVLSGGTTPKPLYELLAQSPFNAAMPWDQTYLFWGDERCVPPDHPHSNFSMANQALISKVDIPPENVHRIPAEMKSPHDAAETYQQNLRQFFSSQARTNNRVPSSTDDEALPSFDLILLGLGGDGHTASLFPGDPMLEEKEMWVAAVSAPEGVFPRTRITLTLPVINRACCVLFLVTGTQKKRIVESILIDPINTYRLYPATMVHPVGRLFWAVY